MHQKIDDLTDEMIRDTIMSPDENNVFIRSHLYLEHYLDLAIDKYFPKQEHLLDVPYFSTDLKLRVLHGIGFLTDVLYLNGKMMNEIRNKYAHRLNPNEDRIQSKINKMVTPWLNEDEESKFDTLSKYKAVAITTVTVVKLALEHNKTTEFFPDVKIPANEK